MHQRSSPRRGSSRAQKPKKRRDTAKHTAPAPTIVKFDQKRIDSRNEDSELIRSALNGDQNAFGRLRQKYHEAIYNLIYRMIRDKDEVEDLTQEAFIKAFTSLSSFNDEYAFSTWLYKIATNNCIDYLRRKKLQTMSINKPMESTDGDMSFELPDTSFIPDNEMILTQRRKFLEEAINSLPPKYRQVIILRHREEKEYQEIADLLKLPLGTVKAHIFRAREMLNKYLRDKLRNY
ncbi:MAG TPA: sigma-70 family RNA polymerase sigma factor [Bacteroidota bacterium]|nr:sigma-70 family RNA polymerase sigma factor [Bacteroidota bacterium]